MGLYHAKMFSALGIKLFGAMTANGHDPRKIAEYDPALGVTELALEAGPNWKDPFYAFWGHCNLDCVYGRLDRWLTEEFLESLDIFGNDPGAICGPLSVYRNVPRVNRLFFQVPGWKEIFESPKFHGFDEGAFSRRVVEADREGIIRFKSSFWQSHDKMPGHTEKPRIHLESDGALWDEVLDKEIMMFHFNRYRKWPL